MHDAPSHYLLSSLTASSTLLAKSSDQHVDNRQAERASFEFDDLGCVSFSLSAVEHCCCDDLPIELSSEGECHVGNEPHFSITWLLKMQVSVPVLAPRPCSVSRLSFCSLRRPTTRHEQRSCEENPGRKLKFIIHHHHPSASCITIIIPALLFLPFRSLLSSFFASL